MAEYRTVRRSEGRGAGASASLRRLPYPAAGHPRSWEWRVRAASFEALVRSVLDPGPSLRVLDLGAGNGWLSHRLWRLGHRPAAVDISADPTDGLAACRAYDEGAGHPVFPRLRADFACLPVAGGAADVAVFNASLHYSPDHEAALAEALRAVRPGGAVVIVDSPFYRNRAAGELMVAERRGRYRRQFGFPSDAHGGREYLTWGELPSLGQRLGVEWTVVRPHYGLRYAARPWMARLRGRRPPSAFAVIVGRR